MQTGHWVGSVVLALLCVVGLTTVAQAKVPGLSPADAKAARSNAIGSKDWSLALAYDDAMLAAKTDEANRATMRADRKEHFRLVCNAAIDKLGPATTDNVEAIIGTLLALRSFATRVEGERQGDLEPIADERMAATLAAMATPMWARVDAIAAGGDVPRAISLAHMIPSADPARIAKLGETLASTHLALAKQATDDLVGARILHARLAAFFGAEIGDLADVPQFLHAEIGRNWVIAADSDCGTHAGSIDAAKERLDVALGRAYPPGPGVSSVLRVTFSECPVTVREWKTSEEKGYLAKEKVSVRVEVPTEYGCGNWSSTSDKGASSTTITSTRYCGYASTETRWEEREVEVERFTKTTIAHRIHRFATKGTISVELYGMTREVPFAFEAESNDDIATGSDCSKKADCPANMRVQGTPHHGWSEWQARLRVHDQLMLEIRTAVSALVTTKVQSYWGRAQAAIDANRPLEADHAFALAHQIIGGSVDSKFEAWMQRQYRLSGVLLLAALGTIARPPFRPEGTYELELPAIALRDEHVFWREGYINREVNTFRRSFWFTFGVGPMFVDTTGGTSSQMGVIASMHVTGLIKKGLVAFRFAGGYGASHGQIELELHGGFGVRAGDFALHAVTGLGMSTSSGNQERVGPTPNNFIVPVAAVWLYGARVSYALPAGYKLEAMYSKLFRGSTELAAEKRLEARLIVKGFALITRYAEYLPDVDSFFGTFDADTRSAKALWILGGGGF